MSQFIPCEVSWTDNSSGDRDELGSEVDIYTDSPSFVPNVPVEVAAIKAKTDSLTFTVAGQVDANIQSVNDVTVNGDGAGTPWGP